MKPAYVPSEVGLALNRIEQRMGRGPTYSTGEINELLNNKMQPYELLFRGRRYGNPSIRQRCEKAIEYLLPLSGEKRLAAAKRVDPLLEELKGWFVA